MRLLEFVHASARKTKTSADELIAHSMHHAEVYELCEIALQFLAKSENMIVHGVGGRMILVVPHFFQFIATDHAIWILHKKLQSLEFLRSQHHNLAVAQHFHFLQVERTVIETNHAEAPTVM
jgi:hypothetical protein